MKSLITPLISGPFWDISNIFQNFLIFSQSLSRQTIQLKVTLVGQFARRTIVGRPTDGRRTVVGRSSDGGRHVVSGAEKKII